MIDKKTHAKLEKKWAKAGRGVYQRWNRLETRMPLFLKHVDKFKGLDVIEFGCNAGIYGYEISKRAKSYIGVDQGDYYIKQANITKKFFEMENVKLSFRDDALAEIARQAIARKSGARGLRAIMEEVMLDIMYETPSKNDIRECIITAPVVRRQEEPELIHVSRKRSA